MAQWSHGFPPGSTEHFFRLSIDQQSRDDSFFDAEALLAGMINGWGTCTPAGLPGCGPRT